MKLHLVLQIVACHQSLQTILAVLVGQNRCGFVKMTEHNVEMYIWIRSSYYSLLEYYLHKINLIYNHYFL